MQHNKMIDLAWFNSLNYAKVMAALPNIGGAL